MEFIILKGKNFEGKVSRVCDASSCAQLQNHGVCKFEGKVSHECDASFYTSDHCCAGTATFHVRCGRNQSCVLSTSIDNDFDLQACVYRSLQSTALAGLPSERFYCVIEGHHSSTV